MGLKRRAVRLPVAGLVSEAGERPPPTGNPAPRAGFLLSGLVVVLLALAGADVAQDTTLGGPGGDALDGSSGGERLLGRSGDDHLRGFAGDDLLFGGAGGDTINGGPGRDALIGGAGDDRLEARDGERDYLNCGAGRDVALVDEEDRVARGCEAVRRGPLP